MAVTGTQIDTKVRYLLQDETPVRWSQAETLAWINAGLFEAAALKPNALVTTANMICVAGTKQTVPAAAMILLDVVRNMGTGGTTPGRAITPIDRNTLDQCNPDWHSATATAVVKHYTFDPANPKSFYVYPPQPSSAMGYVELVYGAIPTPLATLGGNIPFDDSYEIILVDYVAYRAYGKDTENPTSAARAQAHYQAFTGALDARLKSEFVMTPKLKKIPPAGQPPQG